MRDMFITITFKVPGAVVQEAQSRQEDGLPARAAVEAEIRRVVHEFLISDIAPGTKEVA